MGGDDLRRAIDLVDWHAPTERRADGRAVYVVRGRFPFAAPAQGGETWHRVGKVQRSADAVPLDERVLVEEPDPDGGHIGQGDLPPGATGEDGSGKGDEIALAEDGNDEIAMGDGAPRLIAGIASSTSVDFYGTEMSLRALKRMAIQMGRPGGVPYVPRHSLAGGESVEWDGVIGRTVHAEVVPVEGVAKAYNDLEGQFVLRVTTELYEDEPMASALLRRLGRGEPIGQSIGGWFTALNVITNGDGDVERVIVEDVELDHLAVTRAPANPDSLSIVSLRSRIRDAVRASRSASRTVVAPIGGEWAARHVLDVVDGGDRWLVSFAKGHEAEPVAVEGESRSVVEVEINVGGESETEGEGGDAEVGDPIVGAVGDVDPTNFPRAGADEAVDLKNSQWPVFDPEYAEMVRTEYPAIWKEGGNIRGDEQYAALAPVVARGGEVTTADEEHAVRLREAWGARHYGDHRLPGVVAQVKWFVVGELGERGMKAVIDEAIAKIDAEPAAEESADRAVVRSVTPFDDLPLAPEDTEWEWSADVAGEVLGDPENWMRFRRAHVWFDAANPEVRASYKLPIARMFDGQLRVVWRAVVAAVGVLNGARGGVDIPDADREPAYRHLVRYYEKFGKEPPALAGRAVDGSDATTYSNRDARRSAAPDHVHPSAVADIPQERAMADALSAADLRRMLAEVVEPLNKRIDQLEGRSASPVNPSPTAAPANEWQARALAAEARLADSVRGGHRVGVPVAPVLAAPSSPVARTVIGGLVERSRADAPTLAAVVERAASLAFTEVGADTRATKADLVSALADVLNAAEADGIITNPIARAAAGWR